MPQGEGNGDAEEEGGLLRGWRERGLVEVDGARGLRKGDGGEEGGEKRTPMPLLEWIVPRLGHSASRSSETLNCCGMSANPGICGDARGRVSVPFRAGASTEIARASAPCTRLARS